MKNGFIKVGAISPKLVVGNPKYNMEEIVNDLKKTDAQIVAFPELCVSGYSCGDLFYSKELLDEVEEEIVNFLSINTYSGVVILGAPIRANGQLYNCALVIKGNTIMGIVPKTYLPNVGEFVEKRWFNSDYNINTLSFANMEDIPFGLIIFEEEKYNIKFGVEICYDMFAPVSPASLLSVNGANVIFTIAASDEIAGKKEIRKNAVLASSGNNCCAHIYVSAGIFESTSEVVFGGHDLIASNGSLVKESSNFITDTNIIEGLIDLNKTNFDRLHNNALRDSLSYYATDYATVYFALNERDNTPLLDQTPFVPKDKIIEQFLSISSIQEIALYRRLLHINAKCVVIGVSGGLDSTLALLVAHQTFKRLNYDTKGIIAVTMPGLGTTERTKNNAMDLIKKLNLNIKEINISNIVLEHFKQIEQDENKMDITYENAQARMRTLILMDIANQNNGIVVGTGDLSEIALGWCTYNGDQMSMYNVNAGLPKTLIRFMVEQYALEKYSDVKDTLFDIINTPISPELKKDQKTEDSVGKYEINDFIMYQFLVCGASKERINALLEKAFAIDPVPYTSNFFARFYSQQYKRQASPDGPRVLNISLDAKGGFRMPSEVRR